MTSKQQHMYDYYREQYVDRLENLYDKVARHLGDANHLVEYAQEEVEKARRKMYDARTAMVDAEYAAREAN